jgi:hypothetical protein
MSLGYLLASLPMLDANRAPSVSVDAFISACEAALSAKDAEAAAIIVRGAATPSSHPAVVHWRDLEAAIDGAIGRRRLARRGAQTTAVAPETSLCPVWLMRAVDAAFEGAADPLAREEALMGVRWMAAEEMAGFDPLAKMQIFAYAAKLRLATRKAARDAVLGAQRLEEALPKQSL